MVRVKDMLLLLPTATFPKFRPELLAESAPTVTVFGVAGLLPTFVPLQPGSNTTAIAKAVPRQAERKVIPRFCGLALKLICLAYAF